MKELSIKEKAKRYDEALEKSKRLYEQGTITESLCYVFPELKESEDEEIREALLEHIKGIESWEYFLGISKEQMIAWLEKQGQTFTNKDVDDAYLKGMCDAKHELDKQGEQKEYTFKSLPRLLDMIEPTSKAKAYCQKLIDALVKEGYTTDAKIVGECLKAMNGENVPMAIMDEKQGEQKPVDLVAILKDYFANTPKEQQDKDWEELKHLNNFGWELIEQKSTDKVEPKFKQRDWIIFNGLILYVNEVNQGYYRTISIDGIPNSYDWDIDNAARPWTIQDAKDGDVLVGVDNIIIYGGYINNYGGRIGNKAILAYCGWNGEKLVINKKKKEGFGGIGYVPATKEQRDLLFAKMKEAGYEWDAEKKELKEIEPNPIIPKFKVGDVIKDTEDGEVFTIKTITKEKYIYTDGSFDWIKDQDVMNVSILVAEEQQDVAIRLLYVCYNPKE